MILNDINFSNSILGKCAMHARKLHEPPFFNLGTNLSIYFMHGKTHNYSLPRNTQFPCFVLNMSVRRCLSTKYILGTRAI